MKDHFQHIFQVLQERQGPNDEEGVDVASSGKGEDRSGRNGGPFLLFYYFIIFSFFLFFFYGTL